ncbi:PTPRJ phosphatase, partial [Rhinoptilus africanus]|nr:PTPRJ phosphatase [Rhinoptilus africanus]
FTEPSRVHDLRVEHVGVTSVNLTWSVSDAASNYTYRIEVVNGTSVWNLTSSLTKIEITGLIPGTLYNFTVFAAVNDSQTEGEGESIPVYTKPSRVHDLKVEHVGVTSVNLTWSVSDAASNYTYRIEVVNGTSVWNLTSSLTKIEITGLIPGTLYNFTVFAAVNDSQTEGEGESIPVYTKPSRVHDLGAEHVGVTSVNLTWSVSDAASNYTYRIEVVNGTSVWNLTSSLTKIEITGLIPGTLYNFTVFAAVNDSQTEGEGESIPVYTKPSRVHDLKAEYVGVTSVNLTWSVSDAASNYTYRIEVVNGTSVWNLTYTVNEVEITGLIPGTLYNFTVFAAVNDSQTEGEGESVPVYT